MTSTSRTGIAYELTRNVVKSRRSCSIRPVRSAIEHGPAFIVAQALVVEDELPDLTGKLSALPPALAATGRVALAVCRGRARSPDRVRRCTQFVGGHMCHRTSLAGSVPCFARGAEQDSGRGTGVAGGCAGWRHRDLSPSPGARQFDRSPRTIVAWSS